MADDQRGGLAGDGVGPEVISEGRKVLDAVAGSNPGLSFTCTEFPWGSDYYRETGNLMPDDGIEQLAAHDAILFGAIGDPRHDQAPHEKRPGRGLLWLRKNLELYANLRPAKVFPGALDSSPLKPERIEVVDLMLVR